MKQRIAVNQSAHEICGASKDKQARKGKFAQVDALLEETKVRLGQKLRMQRLQTVYLLNVQCPEKCTSTRHQINGF